MTETTTYNGQPGLPPIDILAERHRTRESRMAAAAREVEDLVASDLLAEDRGREILDILNVRTEVKNG